MLETRTLGANLNESSRGAKRQRKRRKRAGGGEVDIKSNNPPDKYTTRLMSTWLDIEMLGITLKVPPSTNLPGLFFVRAAEKVLVTSVNDHFQWHFLRRGDCPARLRIPPNHSKPMQTCPKHVCKDYQCYSYSVDD